MIYNMNVSQMPRKPQDSQEALLKAILFQPFFCLFNPIALRMAKTLWSFGHSECKRVKMSEMIYNVYDKGSHCMLKKMKKALLQEVPKQMMGLDPSDG